MADFTLSVLSVTSTLGISNCTCRGNSFSACREAGAGAVQMDGKDAQAAEDGSGGFRGLDRRIFQTVRDYSAAQDI